ncbi:MAG: alcohol dehydrogenase catalytic domain-containing protein [Pirellulales bacterium]
MVAEVGTNVTGFRAGDRVTFDSTVSCGACSSCCKGRINLCENRQVLGVSCQEFRRHGAFAEFVTVPQNIAYHLPDEFPLNMPGPRRVDRSGIDCRACCQSNADSTRRYSSRHR